LLLPIEQAPVNGRCDSTLGPWARQADNSPPNIDS
jgi:hypothetical protein